MTPPDAAFAIWAELERRRLSFAWAAALGAGELPAGFAGARRGAGCALALLGRLRSFPHTLLTDHAIAEGSIASHGEVLFPALYVDEAVAPWLADRMATATAGRGPWHAA